MEIKTSDSCSAGGGAKTICVKGERNAHVDDDGTEKNWNDNAEAIFVLTY